MKICDTAIRVLQRGRITAPHLDTTCCRSCGGTTILTELDRAHIMNGVRTRKRTWACLGCNESYDTIEIPYEVGVDLWEVEGPRT